MLILSPVWKTSAFLLAHNHPFGMQTPKGQGWELLFAGGTEESQGFLEGLWDLSPWTVPAGLSAFSWCHGCAGQVGTNGWNPSQSLSCGHCKGCASCRDLLGLKDLREAWKSHLLHLHLVPASPPPCRAPHCCWLCRGQNTGRAFDPRGPEQMEVLGLCSVISSCA